jgi:hypothetical protein
MKKNTKTVALFTVLSMMAVGCQKESIEPIESPAVVSEMGTLYRVCYAIDGVTHHITLDSEEAHAAFIYSLLEIAEQGHNVMFYDESKVSQDSVAKEVVTYSTHDKTDAYNWAHNMELDGYKVNVSYDSATNTYNCVAVR